MNPDVQRWLELAEDTKANIRSAINGFKTLSETYSDMRNIGYKNDEKEQIDMAYSEVNALRLELANLQAGGKRKTKKSRQTRRRRHH